MTREAWLTKVISALRPRFRKAGLTIPRRTKASCGWPSSHGTAKSARMRTVAECWLDKDGNPQIFISPTVEDSLEAAGTLCHELIHAALPEDNHGNRFREAMTALGMVGRPVAARPGKELKLALGEVIREIGPYPHVGIKA